MGYFSLCFLSKGTWCAWGTDASIGDAISDSSRTEIVGDAIEDIIRGGNLGGDETFRGIDSYEPGRATKHWGDIFKVASIPVGEVENFDPGVVEGTDGGN